MTHLAPSSSRSSLPSCCCPPSFSSFTSSILPENCTVVSTRLFPSKLRIVLVLSSVSLVLFPLVFPCRSLSHAFLRSDVKQSVVEKPSCYQSVRPTPRTLAPWPFRFRSLRSCSCHLIRTSDTIVAKFWGFTRRSRVSATFAKTTVHKSIIHCVCPPIFTHHFLNYRPSQNKTRGDSVSSVLLNTIQFNSIRGQGNVRDVSNYTTTNL